MPILDDINEKLRDFVAFNSQNPLPTGDPTSGVFNPSKRDLRDLLLLIAQTQGDPDALQAVLDNTVLRTTTTNALANTVVTEPVGSFDGLTDNMLLEVRFAAANAAPPVLKVGFEPTYPIYDAYGAPLPRGAVSAGETAQLVFKATPAPHFRLYKQAYKTGVMQLMTSRSRLEEAATAGATLGDDALYVAGFGAAGDGGHCLMSRQSQVFRTAAGFGIVMDPSVPRKAFGLGMITSLEVEQPAPTSDGWRTAKARFQDDTTRVLSPTGLTFLNGADFERLHSIRPTADGQTAELDASTIPNNRPYKITSLARTGATFVIDGGPGAIWEAEGGGRYLVCQAGATIEFIKVEQNRLYVTALRGGTVTSTNTFTRAVRGLSVLLAGQSILRQAFGAGDGAGAFFDRNAALFSGQTTNFINVALGGSGICERDIGTSDYWVNMTNPASPSDGPLLTAAAAVIASRDGDLTQPQISAILWDQGQTSAGLVDATDAPNANFTRQMYTDASVYALNRLRAMVGGSPTVIFQRLGRARRPVVSDLRWQAIREAQRDVVAAVSGAVLGPETWDLPYKDNLHPDSWGQFNEGVRLAEALATVRGAAGLTGPLTINTVTYSTAGRYIDAALNGSPLRFPDPAGFVVMNAAGVRVNIARIHWSSTTTARLFLEAEATGGTLYYGWGIIEIADDRLIPRRSQSPSILTLAQPIRPSRHAL